MSMYTKGNTTQIQHHLTHGIQLRRQEQRVISNIAINTWENEFML